MEPKSLPGIINDPNHYVKSFKIFAAAGAKLSVYADWVDNVFNGAVVDKIQAKLDGQEELRVLGVGSGSGELDYTMMEKLLQRFPRINNRVVDPSHDLLARYKALAQSKTHEVQGINFDWWQQTIEQYEKAGDLTKFHFISAVHCFYHVDDVDSSLMYLYNCLEPGGILLVVVVSDNSGLGRFRHHFFSSLKGHHHNCITSADIQSSFARRGIPCTQYRQPASLNIARCFDDASEDGRLLMDFITNFVNFKETASEDLQRQMMEYLARSDCSEKSGDQVLLNITWDAAVVCKPLGLD